MRFEILTLFPEMFGGVFDATIIGRAQANGQPGQPLFGPGCPFLLGQVLYPKANQRGEGHRRDKKYPGRGANPAEAGHQVEKQAVKRGSRSQGKQHGEDK